MHVRDGANLSIGHSGILGHDMQLDAAQEILLLLKFTFKIVEKR